MAPDTTETKQAKELVLSWSIVTRADIAKCLRELAKVEDFFHQASIRGSDAKDVPKLSLKLSALATDNKLNLLHAEDRAKLKAFLSKLKAHAPVVHMSFPSEASSDFTTKLLQWFRTNAHPYTVLHIGLQPELAAGCTLRTTNKMFDLSLRKRFEKSKEKLVAALEASR